MTKIFKIILRHSVLFIILLLSVTSQAQNTVTQWRGPERSGIYPEKNLQSVWPEEGPKMILKIEGIGKGYSSAVIHDQKIYVAGLKDTLDVLAAYDLEGKPIWEKAIGRSWFKSYPETRNTPTIEDDRVYIRSGMGDLACLNALNGELIWKRNPYTEFNGKPAYWGMAESVLLTDDAVIYTVGGSDASVVALDKKTGDLVWKSPSVADDGQSYSSPAIIDRNGNKLILVQLQRNLLGINPRNGEFLWTYSLRPDADSLVNWLNHTNTTVYKNGEIFITRGYDMDAIMLSLSEDGSSVALKWKNNVLDTHHGGVVEVNGYIYGSNWINNTKGNWVCLEWDTGKLMYEKEWFNKGSIIYADNHLYCLEDKNGNLALVLPDPDGFNVQSTFRITHGSGPFWAHPTIYDRKLLVRHGEVLMVYDITL